MSFQFQRNQILNRANLLYLWTFPSSEEEEVEELGTFHEIRFVLFPIQSRLHFYTLKRRLKHVRNHKDSGIINARGLQWKPIAWERGTIRSRQIF